MRTSGVSQPEQRRYEIPRTLPAGIIALCLHYTALTPLEPP